MLYENKIVDLSSIINNKYHDEDKRIKKIKRPDGINHTSLNGSDNFRVTTHNVM